MDAGKFQLITEADYVLSPCGRFVPSVGSVVYIPKSFLIQIGRASCRERV